jgi:predicted O-methyltransferase YrrM
MNPMIENPLDYFRLWTPDRPDLFKQLESEAQREDIPIVGPVVGQMLYLLASITRADRVLELGTATGYSTIFLASACKRHNGHILSLEIDATMAQRASDNIKAAGLSDFAEIRCDDALIAIEHLDKPVDMIFLDIEKEDYFRVLPACERLLPSGGLLFADNTGFKDADRFNRAVHENPIWTMVNLWCFLPGHSPDHDGICIALKA